MWILEGIYDRLSEEKREDRFKMEAKIVAALLKKLKGPFEKEKILYFPRAFVPETTAQDLNYYDGVTKFYEGRFDEAYTNFSGHVEPRHHVQSQPPGFLQTSRNRIDVVFRPPGFR